MTVARIWRTSIIAGRKSQYEIFARDISLPMFRQQLGFQVALMARNGIECTVVTLWRQSAAIAALGAIVAIATRAPLPPQVYKSRITHLSRLCHVTIEAAPEAVA